jgi:beta-N-acetylhexosaminidase
MIIKKNMKRVVVLMLLLLFSTSCESRESNSDVDILRKIDTMSLEEKIGQMMMVGLDGYSINKESLRMIKEYHIGGFVILGKNIKDSETLLNLVNALKAKNKEKNSVPLLLSIDEEGGIVSRLPHPFVNLPSNNRVGSKNDEELARKLGVLQAKKLNYFGLNMNFAPVLDINSNLNNPVIGSRSYGNNPDLVSRMGIQTIKGIESEGIIPVVKHFPGHGDTSVDSHTSLPIVHHDIDRLTEFELIPFEEAVKHNVNVIMTAHILLPKIDNESPATLSKAIITDILRERLGFDGVVITDDLTMGAISKNYQLGEAVVKAILAGNDMVLIAHGEENRKQAVASLLSAVRSGKIPEKRIDESVYRILCLKNKYKLTDEIFEQEQNAAIEINNKINALLRKHFNH